MENQIKHDHFLIERNKEHEMRMLQMEIERQKQKELDNHNKRLMEEKNQRKTQNQKELNK